MNRIAGLLGRAGRRAGDPMNGVVALLHHISGVWHLFLLTLYHSFVTPFRGRSKLRKQLFPMMSNVGVRSVLIVSLISVLMGAILVLQTGDVLQTYGQIQEVPGLVALSMTRGLGPLMTAVIMTARVGASFTARTVMSSAALIDPTTACDSDRTLTSLLAASSRLWMASSILPPMPYGQRSPRVSGSPLMPPCLITPLPKRLPSFLILP